MFYWFARTLLVVLMKPLFRYEIAGSYNVPKTGPVIIASNHVSYADPILIALAIKKRQVNFMGKASLFKIPVLGTIITWLNTFPVQKGVADKAAISKSLKLLERGEVLLIFPEGTRIRTGGLGDPYPGVTAIAIKTGASILPMGIVGTGGIMPNGSKMMRFPKLKVRIGKPIAVEKGKAADRREKEAELTARMMTEIKSLIAGG